MENKTFRPFLPEGFKHNYTRVFAFLSSSVNMDPTFSLVLRGSNKKLFFYNSVLKNLFLWHVIQPSHDYFGKSWKKIWFLFHLWEPLSNSTHSTASAMNTIQLALKSPNFSSFFFSIKNIFSTLVSNNDLFFSDFWPDFTGHFPRHESEQTVGSWTLGQVKGLLSNLIHQEASPPLSFPQFSSLTWVSTSNFFLPVLLSLFCLCEVLPGYWIYKSMNVAPPCINWNCTCTPYCIQ